MLDRTLQVETPEQVAVGYELAGPGSRFAAFLLDALLLSLLLLGLGVGALVLFLGGIRIGAAGNLPWGSWLLAAVVVANFLVLWGYFVFFEAFRGGQTPGKRWMGLRVIQASGFPLGLPGAVIRNLVRVLDLQPGLTGILGGLFILWHPRAQRPGDLAAGTVVIRERPVKGLREIVGRVQEHVPVGALGGGPGESEVSTGVGPPLLPDPVWALLETWERERRTLAPAARDRVTERLHATLAERHPAVLPPSGEAAGRRPARRALVRSWTEALARVHREEQARRGRGADGAGGLPAGNGAGSAAATALLRRQARRWRRWDDLLSQARRGGLGTLDEGELADFATLYREVSADLARARTYRGSPDLLASLETSVGEGYNLLYTAPRRSPRAFLEAFIRGFPRLVRRRALPVGIATLLFFGPGAATWLAVLADPPRVEQVVPAVMLDRARAAESLRAQGIGYGEAVIAEAERPIAAASILTNNVRVTFLAFLGGILAGLGTVLILVLNGVMLGGSGAAFQLEGASLHLWSFVLPHGVLELTAICLAGGAGLWLGSALLLPGRQSRGAALVARAREAVAMLGGVVVLLVVAGIIEGFVSPSPHLAEEAKLVFGLLTGFVLFPWLALAGRGGKEEGESEPGSPPP